MGKRGPQPLGNVELRTTVPRSVDDALTVLVALTGTAKATIVRQALIEKFASVGLVHPDAPSAIKPTRTSGRGLRRKDPS